MPDVPDERPLSVTPKQVIAELEAIPEARPWWELAQERAVRKALAVRLQEQEQQLQDAEQELQQLRNDKARRDREADTDRPTDPGPSVITTEV
ncbi:hypothetical protein [Pseudonocardia sp. NPDC049635]|uniref:hypothetical protein n=1 Tax=Pseudonocardia sp. NPDC049635 TaxID=3155506 RepID=UPI0033D9FA7D